MRLFFVLRCHALNVNNSNTTFVMHTTDIDQTPRQLFGFYINATHDHQ
jgi:hypothetical protein